MQAAHAVEVRKGKARLQGRLHLAPLALSFARVACVCAAGAFVRWRVEETLLATALPLHVAEVVCCSAGCGAILLSCSRRPPCAPTHASTR